MITDKLVHVPTSVYNTVTPALPAFPKRGQSFADPVFGSVITRLTANYPAGSDDDLYAKNGFWNADGTRLRVQRGLIIDTTTGAPVKTNVPGDSDGSFDPVKPDLWWFADAAKLCAYSVTAGTVSIVKTFPTTLGPLGGSVDWIDSTGRYMVLNLGGLLRVWAPTPAGGVMYSGAIDAGLLGSGWAGISPDGKYVVLACDGKRWFSFAINHVAKSVPSLGVQFWSTGGDHGDLLSASDGKTYAVLHDSHNKPGLYAVDVAVPRPAMSPTTIPTNVKASIELPWNDNDGHVSCVSRGPLRDWAFFSVESTDDPINAPVANWRPFKQEIVMWNVLTGAVRRLAHHRSRHPVADGYRWQPRVSTSWDGSRVVFPSNMGAAPDPEYADVYALTTGAAVPPVVTPPAHSTHTVEVLIDGVLVKKAPAAKSVELLVDGVSRLKVSPL